MGKLGEAKRQELEERRAAGQGLADGCAKIELLAAGEDEAPPFLPVFIDHHLRVTNGPLTQVHSNRTLAEQETELTGMSHAEVSAFILRSWNVSEEVVEPIEFQFNPGRAPQHRAMAMLLGEANELAKEIIATLPDSPSESRPPSGNPWVDEIASHIREIENW